MPIEFFPKEIKQKRLSSSQKSAIILSANGKCFGCGKKFDAQILDVHHIVPISKGGSNSPRNLAVLCPTCHKKAHSGELKKSDLKGVAKEKLPNDLKTRLKKTRKVKRYDGVKVSVTEKDLKKAKKSISDFLNKEW